MVVGFAQENAIPVHFLQKMFELKERHTNRQNHSYRVNTNSPFFLETPVCVSVCIATPFGGRSLH